ncbi:hypothetical protein N9N28_06810 [Rubripirellula amarantea]|uniref:HPt domain-containing protein n=1 Tax=Rubripirellula amarantea TaxID=2527999 RepID=A0A5C5WTE5_9BACT|nr:hypothetical protein [Rubripirellula amarantea]MDA8744322.1 hypothetical protein [Rubripirellula amarantea]TWT53818.1 hypothetical protein Pla22_14510 [Rubripirellula amarantea]
MAGLTADQRQRFSAALTRLDGDEDTLVMLAEMVTEDAPTMVAQLESEIDSGKLEDVAQTGHALKGLLSTFETGQPVSDLQPIIEAARSGDSGEVAVLFKSAQPRLRELVSEIGNLS